MARRRGSQIGLFLLAAELFSHGLDHIPPVTLVTVAVNVLAYLRLIPFLRSVSKTCVSYALVWRERQWRRLFYASFVHLDDMHLYFNMASFLWKGRSLERRFGSRKFAIVIALFAVLTQIVMILLNKIIATHILFDSSYLKQCAAGFSAVIFGLKVLTTHYMSDSRVSVLGLPISVHPKLVCWVELVMIQILVPNASFTGHLAGILVGLAYIKGPLKGFVKRVNSVLEGGRSNGSQTEGRNLNRFPKESRRLGGSEEDRQLQEAIRRSLLDSGASSAPRNSQPPAYGWNIPGVPVSGNDAVYSASSRGSAPYPPVHTDTMPFHQSFVDNRHAAQQNNLSRRDEIGASAPTLDDIRHDDGYNDKKFNNGALYNVD